MRPVTFLRYKLFFFPFGALGELVFDGGTNTVRVPAASWRTSECRAVQPEDCALRHWCCFWVLGEVPWGGQTPTYPCADTQPGSARYLAAILSQMLKAECDFKSN